MRGVGPWLRLVCQARASGGWLLLTREAILGAGRAVGGVPGADHALPRCRALRGEAGAGMHHRRAPSVDGGDDLLGGDSLQVGDTTAYQPLAYASAITGAWRCSPACAPTATSPLRLGGDTGLSITDKSNVVKTATGACDRGG